MAHYSELSKNIKKAMCWDSFLISPAPRSRLMYEGFRINITAEKEEDIQKAKDILKKAKVDFEDRRATSYTQTIQPGDRTLRVVLPPSVENLKRLWAEEFEKSKFAQTMRERVQKERK